MDYKEIMNSPVLYFITIALLVMVFVQAFVFLRIGLKRAKEAGIEKSRITKAIRSASIVTIVPSIAVVIALIALSPVLGVPVSWGRLSIIGSLAYELLAADLGAKAVGVDLGSVAYTSHAFLSSVFVMCIGSGASIFIVVVFYKSFKKRLTKNIAKTTDIGTSSWNYIFMGAIMMGVYAQFIVDPLVKGGLSAVALLSSAFIMFLATILIDKFKVKWLSEFALPLSMIGGMVVTYLASTF